MLSKTSNEVRYCRDVTRRSASNFYYAFRLLPGEKRDALYAVYAFCRAVDDAADEAGPDDAPRLVAGWRDELERCGRGVPLHPVTIALADARERYPIPLGGPRGRDRGDGDGSPDPAVCDVRRA